MEKIIRNKKIFMWGIIGGIIIIIMGLFYDLIFAGIPYQDPTPVMAQKYTYHRTIAETIELIGIVIILISLLGISLRKLIKLSKSM